MAAANVEHICMNECVCVECFSHLLYGLYNLSPSFSPRLFPFAPPRTSPTSPSVLPPSFPHTQWAAPYQGKNYSCAKCALRPSSGPTNAWTAWINAEDEAAGVYAAL